MMANKSRYYSVLHKTRFYYDAPISESYMEVYMHPRTENLQRCLNFTLKLEPSARTFSYQDYLGNTIHHFDIPQFHNSLTISAESQVQIDPAPDLPDFVPQSAWDALDTLLAENDFWEMLTPSDFTTPTPSLVALSEELNLRTRRDDPLSLLRNLNTALYNSFDYAPNTTKVDSPIDLALDSRQGVCQDFAHIMIAIIRNLGIPCRYVSGYIIPNENHDDRSPEHASHAWIEAYLPELGWTGFDPTNNLIVQDRHIRVAVGRDYADVSPTKGVFTGEAHTELAVSVQVKWMDDLPFEDLLPEDNWEEYNPAQHQQIQIQQQQQQQQ